MNPSPNPGDNPPPLSQPTRYTCANCGFGWNEPTSYCPRCGAAQTPTARQATSPGVLFAYGCGFVLLGSIGACFSLVGFSGLEGGLGLREALNPFTFIGLAFVACALFLLWKLIRGSR